MNPVLLYSSLEIASAVKSKFNQHFQTLSTEERRQFLLQPSTLVLLDTFGGYFTYFTSEDFTTFNNSKEDQEHFDIVSKRYTNYLQLLEYPVLYLQEQPRRRTPAAKRIWRDLIYTRPVYTYTTLHGEIHQLLQIYKNSKVPSEINQLSTTIWRKHQRFTDQKAFLAQKALKASTWFFIRLLQDFEDSRAYHDCLKSPAYQIYESHVRPHVEKYLTPTLGNLLLPHYLFKTEKYGIENRTFSTPSLSDNGSSSTGSEDSTRRNGIQEETSSESNGNGKVLVLDTHHMLYTGVPIPHVQKHESSSDNTTRNGSRLQRRIRRANTPDASTCSQGSQEDTIADRPSARTARPF